MDKKEFLKKAGVILNQEKEERITDYIERLSPYGHPILIAETINKETIPVLLEKAEKDNVDLSFLDKKYKELFREFYLKEPYHIILKDYLDDNFIETYTDLSYLRRSNPKLVSNFSESFYRKWLHIIPYYIFLLKTPTKEDIEGTLNVIFNDNSTIYDFPYYVDKKFTINYLIKFIFGFLKNGDSISIPSICSTLLIKIENVEFVKKIVIDYFSFNNKNLELFFERFASIDSNSITRENNYPSLISLIKELGIDFTDKKYRSLIKKNIDILNFCLRQGKTKEVFNILKEDSILCEYYLRNISLEFITMELYNFVKHINPALLYSIFPIFYFEKGDIKTLSETQEEQLLILKEMILNDLFDVTCNDNYSDILRIDCLDLFRNIEFQFTYSQMERLLTSTIFNKLKSYPEILDWIYSQYASLTK